MSNKKPTQLSYLGSVSDSGEIKLPKRLRAEVSAFLQGCEIEVVFRKKKKHRSSEQNRYYWGAVISIIQAAFKDLGTRLNPEEVHFFLKQKFNYKTLVSVDGELIGEIPQSTAELNKLEFMEYIDKITQWSAEILNIQIPEPKHYDL